ncbi:cupin domain-containing protein [Paraburkholderia nemoris]|uniref:cupin domain-containing protein n=1 Tax=Paraburkholderia nemoris TaxID=2793076 RepID=UPI0038B71E47
MFSKSRTVRGSVLTAVVGLVQTVACAQTLDSDTIRRVVTALDANGHSVVMFDDQLRLSRARPPNASVNLWATQKGPADFSWVDDRANLVKGFSPPKGGSSFRVIEFPPVGPEVEKLPLNTVMRMVGADAPAKGLPVRYPLMHRTRTVDYAIVLSGEIYMMLDDKEVLLKPGDFVVQQATNHAWINRGKTPCRIAFVMLDSEEP